MPACRLLELRSAGIEGRGSDTTSVLDMNRATWKAVRCIKLRISCEVRGRTLLNEPVSINAQYQFGLLVDVSGH
jgi:hypothetical protein